MLSYWEQQSFTRYQYAVVGGGLVGLSTALSLKEMDPGASVVILERGIIPKGASTRNAGFACFGSLTELLNDLDYLSEEEVVQLVQDRWTGLRKLRKRVGDKTLGYENHGGYELLFEKDIGCLDRLEQVNQMLEPIFHQRVFSFDQHLAKKFGFNQQRIAGIIVNPLEGQLNTGEMVKSLISMARSRGIDYLTGAFVSDFDNQSDEIQLSVSNAPIEKSKSGPVTDSITFKVRRMAICTNAFSEQLLDKPQVIPGRGQVLITEAIPNLKFEGTFHYDAGYYYFRNVGDRVLFGGARNQDFITERTVEFGVNEQIYSHLLKELEDLILPGVAFKIAANWSGIMGFGKDKRPSVHLDSPNVGYAVGLGGMGVALGTQVGNRLAQLICLNPENA